MFAEGTREVEEWTARGGPAGPVSGRELLLELNLLATSRVQFYRSGQTIVAQEETAPFVGFVESGVLRIVNGMAEGSRRIVGFIGSDAIFGHELDGYRRFALEAASDVALHQIDRRLFADLVEEAVPLRSRLVQQLRSELDAARDLIVLLGQRQVTQRLALYLLGLHRRLPEGPGARRDEPLVLTVPVCRRDLADYLATTQESVSRGLHGLVREGAIRILQPNRFEITSLDLLRQVSDGGTEAEKPPATPPIRERQARSHTPLRVPVRRNGRPRGLGPSS